MTELEKLWEWAVDLARSSRAPAPLVIHSQSGDRDGWEWDERTDPRDAIRGLPFSRSFERRVDHELPKSVRAALDDMKAPRNADGRQHRASQARQNMWRIVSDVVRNGETSSEACRAKHGLTPFTFHVAALNGLLAFRSALERY